MNHVISLSINMNSIYYLRDSGSHYVYSFGRNQPTPKNIKYGVTHILSCLVPFPYGLGHFIRIQDLLPDVVELPYDVTDILTMLELLG